MNNKSHIIPYFTAIITNFIFGLSFLFSKQALNVAGPISLLSFRFLTAFIVMTILIIVKVIKVDYKNKPMKWLIILAIVEPIIYFIFETYRAWKKLFHIFRWTYDCTYTNSGNNFSSIFIK